MKAIRESKALQILKSPSGAIGYLFAWLLGVPASLLLIIFLIRGH